MVSGDAPLVNNILSYVSQASLVSLRIRYHSQNRSLETWRARIAQISQWSGSLLHLELGEHLPSSGSFDYAEEISLLDSLLAIRSMRILVLRLPITCDFSDATPSFEKLAAAWPEMERLDLQTVVSKTKPQATFSTLESFAFHCSGLRRDLSVALNIHILPFAPRLSSRTLRNLRVYSRVTGDPYSITRRLDALFPCLQSLHGCDNLWLGNCKADSNK